MEFVEKAKIMLERWIDHSDHHQEEYEAFADQLEEVGEAESARYVREMTEFLCPAVQQPAHAKQDPR